MENEIWRDIPGYEGLYQVSNLGRIKTLERIYFCGNHHSARIQREKLLKTTSVGGYKRVLITKNNKRKGYLVHRLVAIVFIPNPDNLPQINHKNEIKTDNRVENLEWCTAQYNNRYGNRRKKMILKNTNGKKSTPVICLETNIIYPSQSQVQRETGIPQSYISACCARKGKTKGLSFRML